MPSKVPRFMEIKTAYHYYFCSSGLLLVHPAWWKMLWDVYIGLLDDFAVDWLKYKWCFAWFVAKMPTSKVCTFPRTWKSKLKWISKSEHKNVGHPLFSAYNIGNSTLFQKVKVPLWHRRIILALIIFVTSRSYHERKLSFSWFQKYSVTSCLKLQVRHKRCYKHRNTSVIGLTWYGSLSCK